MTFWLVKDGFGKDMVGMVLNSTYNILRNRDLYLKQAVLLVLLLFFFLIIFFFVNTKNAFADEAAGTKNLTSSSSLQSSEVDKDGNITYTIHCPTYKTANNRKWDSSNNIYYYITDSMNYVSMYRLYNPNSGEHFYTSNSVERNNLIGYGWTYEGIGWTAPKSSKTPVYRLYNPNAGDHHYTTAAAEKDKLNNLGWIYEGIGWYSDDAKSVPLYRQYNPNALAGSHNFTTSLEENDKLKSYGWIPEGIGWYGVSHTSHTWATVEYADESKTNSIRTADFCPEHECEFLDDAHKWSSAGGYCPADKECSKEKYVSVRLYVHKKVMCTVCGAEK